MLEDKPTLIEELLQFVDDGENLAEDYREQCDMVGRVYDGDYEGGNGKSGANPIKSNLMYTETRKNISRLMLPADFKFDAMPSNPNNAIDDAGALTAKSILKYYWNTQKMWKLARKVLIDATLYDKGFLFTGYKPTNKIKDVFEAFDSEGANKRSGQPYNSRIRYSNFIIEDGFESIDDTYRTGGKIGVRCDVHIDWIKANKAFKNKSEVEPEIPYRGMRQDDPQSAENSERVGRKNKYVITWQIYEAPSNNHKKGRFFVINRKNNVILYQQNALPFKGMGFPVKELVFSESQNEYWSKPLAYRSLNSLFEYEQFETKVRNLVEAVKSIIMGSTKKGAEDVNAQMQRIADFGYVDLDNAFQDGQVPLNFSFAPDTIPAERASLSSLSRFKGMYSSAETTNPFQKEQIATQIRVDSASALQEVNDQRVNVNQFWIEVAEDMIKLTKLYTPKKEQIRMTRQVDMTIHDKNQITLDGDYSMVITTSPLLDMSMGEELNAKTGLLQTLIQLQSIPQTADRIDIVPAVEAVVAELGMPATRVIKPSNMSDPKFENSMLVLGMPIQSHPTDNHIKHLQTHQGYADQLTQFSQDPKAMEQLTFDYGSAIETINAHVDMHIQMGDLQSDGNQNAGAWKQAKNAVNNARQSQAKGVSASGAAGVQGAGSGGNQ